MAILRDRQPDTASVTIFATMYEAVCMLPEELQLAIMHAMFEFMLYGETTNEDSNILYGKPTSIDEDPIAHSLFTSVRPGLQKLRSRKIASRDREMTKKGMQEPQIILESVECACKQADDNRSSDKTITDHKSTTTGAELDHKLTTTDAEPDHKSTTNEAEIEDKGEWGNENCELRIENCKDLTCSVRGESFSRELDHVLAHDLKTPLTPLEGGDHLRDHADAQPAEADSAEKNSAEGAPSEKPEKPKKQRKPAKGTLSPEVEEWFDNEFWPSYPRKVSKQKARESMAKINPDAETREAIMQGLDNAKRFNESWQRREDLRYVPHATTWLNQRRWEDEYDTSHELTVVGGEVTVKKTAEERHQELNEKRGIHQPFDPKIPLSKQFPRMGLTEELRNELMAEYVQEQFEEYGVRYII